MSDEVFDASSPAELAFSHADIAGDTRTCGSCQSSIGARYFDVGGIHTCEPCGIALRDGPGTAAARAMRAIFFGGLAATLSGLLWYGIRASTGYELGLIAIGVGFAVGFGVRFGAHQRGGWFYQALAIGLTYSAIALTYVPEVMDMMMAEDPGAPAFVVGMIATVLSFAVPVLQVFDGGVMGFIILLIALYEAWKINKRPEIEIQGPFATPAAVPFAAPALQPELAPASPFPTP
ncbi:MAG: hypothetical protein MUE69_21000 [Myxococcota bacterium]|jgi:hypothetical protein|nr:hypothetical protein [Myxococcota bacterium]